ncbi:MAG: hypothetical protein HQL48_05010 [Gammaproteobacteria bacterium]|nr:hypothetical protein [Gammaproteobacteria bacterium]
MSLLYKALQQLESAENGNLNPFVSKDSRPASDFKKKYGVVAVGAVLLLLLTALVFSHWIMGNGEELPHQTTADQSPFQGIESPPFQPAPTTDPLPQQPQPQLKQLAPTVADGDQPIPEKIQQNAVITKQNNATDEAAQKRERSFTLPPTTKTNERESASAAVKQIQPHARINSTQQQELTPTQRQIVTSDSAISIQQKTVVTSPQNPKAPPTTKASDSDPQTTTPRNSQQLVHQLKRSIREGEKEEVIQKILQQLRQLRSPDDPFVLKMEAFWEIKRANYAHAAQLLSLVLEQQPNDLDANINMSIVEMHQQQISEAHSRLKRLATLYPGNDWVNAALARLQ